MKDLLRIEGRRVGLIYVTTSRAFPAATSHLGTDLAAHLASDDRAPFHEWIASDGRHVSKVRDPDTVVVPDGNIWAGVASVLYVVCFSGWYHSSRARGEGGEAQPQEPGMARLVARVRELALEMSLTTKAIVGPWDFGAHAWAGDVVEFSMRSLRGEPSPYRPGNRFEYHPPMLRAVNDPREVAEGIGRRNALRTLGFDATAPAEEPNGAWNARDQLALIRCQEAYGLEVTGWWDPVTIVTLREALAQATKAPARTAAPAAE